VEVSEETAGGLDLADERGDVFVKGDGEVVAQSEEDQCNSITSRCLQPAPMLLHELYKDMKSRRLLVEAQYCAHQQTTYGRSKEKKTESKVGSDDRECLSSRSRNAVHFLRRAEKRLCGIASN